MAVSEEDPGMQYEDETTGGTSADSNMQYEGKKAAGTEMQYEDESAASPEMQYEDKKQ